MRPQFIAYYRVSTQRQGASGLGLEAQQAAVQRYVAAQEGEITTAYREIESGRRNDRPELQKAIAQARRARAILIAAKLDRFGRDAAETLRLLTKSGVEIVDVSDPHMSKLTAGIKAVIAEDEAERISSRTKDALEAAKARGVKLGSHRKGHWTAARHRKRVEALERGREASLRARRAHSQEVIEDLIPMLREWKEQGLSCYRIAKELNERGQRTIRGGMWRSNQVARVLERVKEGITPRTA